MRPIFLLLVLTLLHSISWGQVSVIDTSFGNGGHVYTPLSSQALSSSTCTIQSDQKIVVAGNNHVARYNPDGVIDSSFGANGVFTSTNLDLISDVIELSNGDLLIGGASGNPTFTSTHGKVIKLSSNGILDTSFGTMGVSILPAIYDPNWIFDLIDGHRVNILEEEPSGDIKVYGTAKGVIWSSSSSSSEPAAVTFRLHSDGSIDSTFNQIGFSIGYGGGLSKKVEVNGEYYFLNPGDIKNPGGSFGPPIPPIGLRHMPAFVSKLDSLSNIDSTFQSNFLNSWGALTAPKPMDLSVQSGKLLVCGYRSTPTSISTIPSLDNLFSVFRLNLDGTIDSSFAVNGRQNIFLDSNSAATDIHVFNDQSFVVIGVNTPPSGIESKLVMVSFNPDGSLDSSCSTPFRHGLSSGFSIKHIVEQTPNIVRVIGNKMLVASIRDSGSTYGIQLAQYFTTPDTAVAIQDGSTLIAQSAYGSYQWLDCNSDQIIPGATQQSFTPQSNGDYAVIINQMGCTDTSACVNINTVGVRESDRLSARVYPIPSSGQFSISFGETSFSGIIEIHSLSGQCLLKEKLQNTTETHLNTALSSGMYILVLTNSEHIITKRIIIE